jgi:hypothetical protein
MADDKPTTPPAEPAAPQGQHASTGSATGDQPGPVPYERFREVNEKLRQLSAAQEKAEATAKAKSEKELQEQQKWQELYQARENELKAERTRNLKMQVALQKGLPADLIDRLQGDDAEAIAKDADTLLQFIKPATAPGVPPGNRNSQPARLDINNMTPEEIRKHAGSLLKQSQTAR